QGNFSISAGASSTFVFLKSGFKTKESAVNNQTTLQVSLAPGSDEPVQDSGPPATPNSSNKPVQESSHSTSQTPVTATSTPTQGGVSGTVSGPSGPLAGVTVQVRGASISTSTDEQGKFQIAAQPNQTLVFNSVGYQQTSQQVGANKTLAITMQT